MANDKYDWALIKSDYATSNVSYQDIADKYQIPHRTVCERGLRESWSDARKKYCKNVVKKTTTKRSNDTAAKIKKIIKVADGLTKMLQDIIINDDQTTTYIYNDKSTGEPLEKTLKKIDTKALREVASALRDVTATFDLISPIRTEENDNQTRIVFSDSESEEYSG